MDSLTLDEAVALLDEKAGKQGGGAPPKTTRKIPAKRSGAPRAKPPIDIAPAAKTRKPATVKPIPAKRPAAVTATATAKRAPARKKPVLSRRTAQKP
jgi:hypothetical protein